MPSCALLLPSAEKRKSETCWVVLSLIVLRVLVGLPSPPHGGGICSASKLSVPIKEKFVQQQQQQQTPLPALPLP